MNWKEKKDKDYIIHGFWIMLLSLLLPSCYQPRLGCLDPQSANYDVLADGPCDQCCTYPRITIEVQHRIGTLLYTLSDTINNNLGERFLVLDQKIYLSDIQISNPLGIPIPLRDSVAFVRAVDGSRVNAAHQFNMVRQTQGSFDISTTGYSGLVTGLSMQVGLPENFNEFSTNMLPPLGNIISTVENMRIDNRLASAYWRISDLNRQDTFNVYLSGITPLIMPFTSALENLRGRPLRLPIRLQMDVLFRNVDWSDPSTWESSIRDNLPSAIVAGN